MLNYYRAFKRRKDREQLEIEDETLPVDDTGIIALRLNRLWGELMQAAERLRRFALPDGDEVERGRAARRSGSGTRRAASNHALHTSRARRPAAKEAT